MRTRLLVLVALFCASSAAPARAAALWEMFAETQVRRVVLTPAYVPPRPGTQPAETPTESETLAGGRPLRHLEIRLRSPGLAPAGASAFVTPPAGLGLGPRLPLTLSRPTAPRPGPPTRNYLLKLYWGSSSTARPGQPKLLRFADLTPEQQAALQRQLAELALGPPWPPRPRPNETLAFWPPEPPLGQVGPTASLAGRYTLTTTYAGNAMLLVPQRTNFLAPLTLLRPDLAHRLPLNRALPLHWNRLPRLVGQQALVIGKEGENTLVLWMAAPRATAALFRDWKHLEPQTIRELVRHGALLPPGQTRVTLPAGIFANVDLAHLVLIGYGPETRAPSPQYRARLATRTTLLAVLGGQSVVGQTTHRGESEEEEMERERREPGRRK